MVGWHGCSDNTDRYIQFVNATVRLNSNIGFRHSQTTMNSRCTGVAGSCIYSFHFIPIV